jgi:hypothetical protein
MKHINSMEKTQGVLKLKRMVHLVTNDYCEPWRVENTKTVITKMVAPVFLCLLGVSRYWGVLTALSAEKEHLSPPLPRTVGSVGPRGGKLPALSDVTREITFTARSRMPTLRSSIPFPNYYFKIQHPLYSICCTP